MDVDGNADLISPDGTKWVHGIVTNVEFSTPSDFIPTQLAEDTDSVLSMLYVHLHCMLGVN